MTPAGDQLRKRSEITTYEVVFPSMVNHLGTLFGGSALQWMDRAAWVCATRLCRKTMVTIASDRVEFKKPVYQGDVVMLAARAIRLGQTSVTIEVELHSEDPLTGERHLATRGEFVMVALDKQGKATPISAEASATESDD